MALVLASQETLIGVNVFGRLHYLGDGSSWLRLLTGDSGSSRARFQIDNSQVFRQA